MGTTGNRMLHNNSLYSDDWGTCLTSLWQISEISLLGVLRHLPWHTVPGTEVLSLGHVIQPLLTGSIVDEGLIQVLQYFIYRTFEFLISQIAKRRPPIKVYMRLNPRLNWKHFTRPYHNFYTEGGGVKSPKFRLDFRPQCPVPFEFPAFREEAILY